MNTRRAMAEGQHPRQFQALPGDGEHQKANPKRNGSVNGSPRQPQQIAQQPAQGPEGERQREQRTLAAEIRDRDGDHDGTAHRDKGGGGGERRAEDSRRCV